MKRINIIAEGDSWFSYPEEPWVIPILGMRSTDVLARFMYRARKYQLVRGGALAMRGESLAKMRAKEEKGEAILEELKKLNNVNNTDQEYHIKAMIFSGGGNDLIENLNNIILYKKDVKLSNPEARVCLDRNALGTLKERVKNDYQYFINLCKNYNVKLITHTYYYPNPTKGGARLLGGMLKVTDPWFKKEFEGKGYEGEIDLQKDICKYLIKDYFIPLLKELKKTNQSDFDFVNVTEIGLKEKDQLDEIHLNASGCIKVAKAFIKKLNGYF